MDVNKEASEFWERAAMAALTGLCASGINLDPKSAAEQAAALADALLLNQQSRLGG